MSTSASEDEKSGAFVTYILTAIVGVIGALVGWAIFKDKGPFAKDQTTEALNWSITMFIVFVGLQILAMMAAHILFFLSGILWLVIMAAWLGHVVLCIMAALKAKEGSAYRYPFALRLIK